jgi:hypothetical protein
VLFATIIHRPILLSHLGLQQGRARISIADSKGPAQGVGLLISSSQNAPCTDFRLCEVALLGDYPRSARHGSVARSRLHFLGYVTSMPHPSTPTVGPRLRRPSRAPPHPPLARAREPWPSRCPSPRLFATRRARRTTSMTTRSAKQRGVSSHRVMDAALLHHLRDLCQSERR